MNKKLYKAILIIFLLLFNIIMWGWLIREFSNDSKHEEKLLSKSHELRSNFSRQLPHFKSLIDSAPFKAVNSYKLKAFIILDNDTDSIHQLYDFIIERQYEKSLTNSENILSEIAQNPDEVKSVVIINKNSDFYKTYQLGTTVVQVFSSPIRIRILDIENLSIVIDTVFQDRVINYMPQQFKLKLMNDRVYGYATLIPANDDPNSLRGFDFNFKYQSKYELLIYHIIFHTRNEMFVNDIEDWVIELLKNEG